MITKRALFDMFCDIDIHLSELEARLELLEEKSKKAKAKPVKSKKPTDKSHNKPRKK